MKSLNLLFCYLTGICFIYNKAINGKDQKGELTPNAKDIGVLYLMFALFSGLVGIILFLWNVDAGEYWLLLDYKNKEDLFLFLEIPIVTSTEAEKKLNPWFVTGFVDGEGCFQISILPNKELKSGYRVKPIFSISLHDKDIALLESIQRSLGVGKIYEYDKNCIQYRVYSMEELKIIINHFDKYPLITQKLADYILFKQGLELIDNKEHLSIEGLKKLLSIKASINLGNSESLKAAFPNIIPVSRPLVTNQSIVDPFWLAGFTSGEGCFLIRIGKSPTHQTGFKIELRFSIAQHSRDAELIKSLVTYLDCGKVNNHSRNALDFTVQKFSDITFKIIPFFNQYQLIGSKAKDFLDFKQVALLMSNKEHLITHGLNKIREIKLGMNRGRRF